MSTRAESGQSAALLAAGCVALLLVAVFRHVVLAGAVFYERDVSLLWHAQAAGFSRALASGAWPLWDPHLGFGQPLLGNPNNQVLYPPTWLLAVWPAWRCYSVLVLGHLFLGAMGVAALARRLGFGASASATAAALWTASGPVLSLVNLWNHLCGAAWLPWALFALEGRLRGTRGRHTLVLGVALAAQLLAGSPDLLLLTALLLLARVVVALASSRSAGERLATLRFALLAGALALGLSAGQWLVTLDLLRGAERWQLPAAARTYWSVPPPALLQTLAPVLYRDLPLAAGGEPLSDELQSPLLGSLYLGLPAAVLVAAALGSGRRRLVIGLAVLAATGVLLSLGRYWAPAAFLGSLPPLHTLRYPAKAMVLTALAWSLLAGLGLHAWFGRGSSRLARTGALLVALVAAGALGLAAVASFGAERFAASLVSLGPAGPSYQALLAPAAASLARAGALAVAACALFAASLRQPSRWTGLAVALAAAFDLAAFHDNLNRTTDASLFTSRPPVLEALPSSRPTRVYAWDYLRVRSVGGAAPQRDLAARVPAGWSGSLARSVALQAYLYPPAQARWGLSGSFDKDVVALERPEQRSFALLPRIHEGGAAFVRLMRMAGVASVLTLHDEGLESLELAARLESLLAEPIRVRRVPQPLPRAYVVPSARVSSPAELAAWILDPEFDFSREVLLEDPAAPSLGGNGSDGFSGGARLVRLEADRVEIDSHATAPGFLVLLDAWDPGWRARVDGAEAPVWRANGVFRAVPVSAGAHRVEMRYRPSGLVPGLAVSALSLLALLAALARPRRRAENA